MSMEMSSITYVAYLDFLESMTPHLMRTRA